MRTMRRAFAVLAASVLAASCADRPTPTESALTPTDAQLARSAATSSLLTDIPVTQTLADGGTLEGLLSITNLSLQDGQLLASGTLTGTLTDAAGTVTEFTQTFTDTALDLLGSGSGGSCEILSLDLGPLNLDLLGLVVDLSAVELDVTAQPGPGNLLGNLLCAVAGLLDRDGPVSAIENLLNQINNLLG